ncbi:MAG: OmpA family protein [Gammaproteobacteria bacterium]|jgi:outer membrane protein OmpA-like peptidoglycan-associated protein|nr:hypothetical protein [Chromatiales bacterium]MDP6675414.1 OmpA family protein [Gammaproteobacteria bacterium]
MALLAEAESELTENRYDTDLPRSLARQANYEARHALHLTGYLKHAKQLRRTPEDLVLEWESPLQQIADRDDEIMVLNQEVDVLQEQLGGADSARADLQHRLRAQAQLRQQVKQIESTFDRQEAQVFRDSNEIYLRLVGLSFASGSSNIGGDNYKMLSKVQDAIRVFPESQIVIEGHTDSYGGDDSNMTLSEQRDAPGPCAEPAYRCTDCAEPGYRGQSYGRDFRDGALSYSAQIESLSTRTW